MLRPHFQHFMYIFYEGGGLGGVKSFFRKLPGLLENWSYVWGSIIEKSYLFLPFSVFKEVSCACRVKF